MDFIIDFIKIVFILGFLIFIHEGGHFIVARLCKVKVEEFAIGFGPKLWEKKGKETKYILLENFVELNVLAIKTLRLCNGDVVELCIDNEMITILPQ